jgi:hypothetical protein
MRDNTRTLREQRQQCDTRRSEGGRGQEGEREGEREGLLLTTSGMSIRKMN